MKRVELFLTVIILGSLWGFIEVMPLPVSVLCAAGVFFLVLGRRICNIPGTSIVIGLIVCFYKTYSDNFFVCQWAGVMALAGSFELFAGLILKDNLQRMNRIILTGVLTNVSALIIFVLTVNYVFIEPYWASGGIDRVINYAVQTVFPAALISGLVTAPLGLIIGSKISNLHLKFHRKIVFPGLYAIATMLLWAAASIVK